ncbi:MAG: polyprenyl synthetase family protein, partial [Sphingomonadales bacterium]
MTFAEDEVSRGTQLLLSTQAEVAAGIDQLFDTLLTIPADPRGPLYEAMRHAAVAGGKRLRPLLVRAAGDLFHVDRSLTLRVGAAVEAMHV